MREREREKAQTSELGGDIDEISSRRLHNHASIDQSRQDEVEDEDEDDEEEEDEEGSKKKKKKK